MTGIFVTATGTELGKTFVSAQLLRCAQRQRMAFLPSKPIISGWPEQHSEIENTDTAILLKSAGFSVNDENIAAISPWRFTLPLSPDMAAKAEGRTMDIEALLAFCERRDLLAKAQGKIHLIEGVGGVMSPINGRYTNLEWLHALHYRCILITGSYLGSLSHTLTALKVLETQGIQVAAVVVNESPNSTVPHAETVNYLKQYLHSRWVFPMPYQRQVLPMELLLPLYECITQK